MISQDDTIEVTTPTCCECGRASSLRLPRVGYELWRAGLFIQNALPTLTAGEREMLMTGTHPNCWDQLMAAIGGDDE